MRAPLRRVATGLACATALALSAPWWGPVYCAALLPAAGAVLGATAGPWQAVHTTLEAGAQDVVVARFETATGFDYRGFAVPPGAWVRTQTLQGYWWQHPVILLGLWAAWPLAGLRARLAGAGAVAAALVFLAMVDLPLTLHGALAELMLAGTAPAQATTSVPVQAMRLLEGGGRAALCLALGVALLAVIGAVTGAPRRRTGPAAIAMPRMGNTRSP